MIKLPRLPDHLNAQWPYLPHQLRARDIEVARVVLEAAADCIEMYGLTGYAECIRALRIEGETT